MRRAVVLVLMAVVLLFPPVWASEFYGLISIPGNVFVGNTTMELRDASMIDGSLVGVYSNETHSEWFLLYLGENLTVGYVRLRYLGLLAGDDRTFALINFTFPYLFEGQELTLGEYEVKVVSVASSGAKIWVSDGNESKEFTSTEFKYGHLQFNVRALPKIFEGYLKVNESVEIPGYAIVLRNITVENTTSGFTEIAYFEYNGGFFGVEAGKEADVGPFRISVKDVIGAEYAQVDVFLRGVSLNIRTVPDMEFELSLGQTKTLGPYIFRYDYYFDGAEVSLLNSCGEVLTSEKLTSGNVSKILSYGGLVVGIESVEGELVKFFAFIDKTRIPDVNKVANLEISVEAPDGKQYVPLNVKVTVKNTGTVTLSNVSLAFVPSRDARILSGKTFAIEILKPGETREYNVQLVPLQSGNVSLGHVQARVVAPFELACGGFTTLTYRSNELVLEIAPSIVSYNVSVELPNSTMLYHPLNVSLKITNSGDVQVPANVTIEVPEGVMVEPNGQFVYHKGFISAPLLLAPGQNMTLRLMLIPYTAGRKEFKVTVETHYSPVNMASFGFLVIENEGSQCELPSETVCPNSTTVVTKTITQTVTVTSTTTQSITQTVVKNQTALYCPTTKKLIWGALGFVLGALAIILLAWYQARKS